MELFIDGLSVKSMENSFEIESDKNYEDSTSKEEDIIQHSSKQLAIFNASTGQEVTSESRHPNPRKRSFDIGSESEVAKAAVQQRKSK